MKNYRITVNGTVYDVTVEESSGTPVAATQKASQTVETARPASSAPAAPAKPAAAPKAKGTTGGIRVEAGAAGKIFKIESSVGQVVKAGDSIVILEAMKMEIPVVAPQDGTIASIDVVVGDSVEAGALLATLN
ncbi:biotin/lipoyl-containing protein [Anaerosacchariphilus polymeriproducens]|uniref:Biotin/lipoyl-binding protein n=1 Tax=Anaerosacchariphilus polymeriproducens TaxID=1812858 RepID=A0A371AUB3_9FIRM|nr:biotin/lipoyl-containing protein [Anaerosacchariphilus polymeriproducens]RDU23132.1 biotin/lipoyl-binding protein [Anaerosacchariphilus polymeriproducens]